MKKIKIAFWVIVIALLALVGYQNWAYFKTKHIISVNLGVDAYQSPELPNAIFFLAVFFIGLLISYIYSLFERFRSRKTIKELNAQIENRNQTLNTLKTEIDTLKSGSLEVPPVPEEATEETKAEEERPPADTTATIVNQ